MANANQPMGFIPRRHKGGVAPRFLEPFKIQSGYATSMFAGDAVILVSGYVTKGLENSATLLGIFWGCRYRDAAGKTTFSRYWPASTATLGSEDVEAFIYADRDILYRVQTSAGTAYVDATHKGGAFDLISTVAGSTITGNSGMELNLGDTGTGQFRVVGLIDEPTNAAGTNAKIEVEIAVPLLL